VTRRPVVFAKLPDVDDVSVEDDKPRVDAVDVGMQFLGMATHRTEVYIGKNENIDWAPFHTLSTTKEHAQGQQIVNLL